MHRDMVAIETMLALSGFLRQICSALVPQTATQETLALMHACVYTVFMCLCVLWFLKFSAITYPYIVLFKLWLSNACNVDVCLDVHLCVCVYGWRSSCFSKAVFSEGWLSSSGSWIHPCLRASVTVVCVKCCEGRFYSAVFEPNCVRNAKCSTPSGVCLSDYQSVGATTQCLHTEHTLSNVSHAILCQIYSLLVSINWWERIVPLSN